MKVAIVQPGYLPWKGRFDMINAVDVFIFLEDVQYTKREWQNRNKIRTINGNSLWLSVPIKAKRNTILYQAAIDNDQNWKRKHLESIRYNYSRTPFFEEYYQKLISVYDNPTKKWEYISDLNIALTKEIATWLGINTRFESSLDFISDGMKDDKLIHLIQAVGGDHYISGVKAQNYIIDEKFERANIKLEYLNTSSYPKYEQISKPFDHYVSILDLLFMKGPEAPKYIWDNNGEIK